MRQSCRIGVFKLGGPSKPAVCTSDPSFSGSGNAVAVWPLRMAAAAGGLRANYTSVASNGAQQAGHIYLQDIPGQEISLTHTASYIPQPQPRHTTQPEPQTHRVITNNCNALCPFSASTFTFPNMRRMALSSRIHNHVNHAKSVFAIDPNPSNSP